MMTIQESNKKQVIKSLKIDGRYYKDFRKRYYKSPTYKFFYEAFFNSFCPSYILRIMCRNNMISIAIHDIISKNIVSIPYFKFLSIFKNCFDVTFRAETNKDKIKLYNFCLKYGIIPENHSSELEKFINKCNTFYITEYMVLEAHYFSTNYIPLYKFINDFEDAAYIANNIKVNFFKRFIQKLKVKYSV